jgi:hypothetical protein
MESRQGTDMKKPASLKGEAFGQGLDEERLRQLQHTQEPPASKVSRHREPILILA